MTVGILEAWSSAVGDELTELAGFRSTRLTALFKIEKQVQSAVNTASWSFSLSVLLGTWAWDGTTTVLATNTSQVQVDDYVRDTADAQDFKITAISLGTGPAGEDEVTIANPDSLTIPTSAAGSSVIDPAVITLSGAPDFLASVAANQRFRVLSDAETAESVLVGSRDSGTQVTAQTGFRTAQANVSWEIVIDPETTMQVETTLDWSNSGQVWLDGVRYSYASKTLISLDGVKHFDGIAFVDGALGKLIAATRQRTDHPPLSQVADFTRNFSAADITRRSFLVEFATGEDLNIIGRNLGVERPPELGDDEIFRKLIQAIAYTPRGTVYALELALTALLGAGNFEIIEDLTLGSPINHPARVYFRRTDADSSLISAGKAWLDGPEFAESVSLSQIDLVDDPLRINSVKLANEGEFRQSGSGTDATTSGNGYLVDGPVAEFPVNVMEFDTFVITGVRTDFSLLGRTAIVAKRVGDQQLRLFTPIPNVSDIVSWKTIRRGTSFRINLPGVDLANEHAITPGQGWVYIGATAEGTTIAHASAPGDGDYMEMTDTAVLDTSGYDRLMRIRPESDAYVELTLSPQNAPPHGTFGGDSGSAIDGEQFYFGLRDGFADCRVGVFNDSGATRFRFIDQSGNKLTAGVTGSGQNISPGSYGTVRLVKIGQQKFQLWVQRVPGQAALLSQEIDYALVPFSGGVGSFTFGMFATTQTGYIMRFKEANWGVENPTEYNSTRVTGGTITAPNRLTDGGINSYFDVGDVGVKRVRIADYNTPNASGGNPIGEWEIADRPDADNVDLIGPTREGAFTQSIRNDLIQIRGDDRPFVFPRHAGFSIELLTGPDAGVYTIADFLKPDAIDGVDPSLNQFPDSLAAGRLDVIGEHPTSVIRVGNPPASGFSAQQELQWRLIPAFATDAGPINYIIVDTAVITAGNQVTFPRQILPLHNQASWTAIWEVNYSTVLSAQIRDPLDLNSGTSPNYALFPFYLHDDWGFIQRILDALTVAGVIPVFDGLVVDAAGQHIIDSD